MALSELVQRSSDSWRSHKKGPAPPPPIGITLRNADSNTASLHQGRGDGDVVDEEDESGIYVDAESDLSRQESFNENPEVDDATLCNEDLGEVHAENTSDATHSVTSTFLPDEERQDHEEENQVHAEGRQNQPHEASPPPPPPPPPPLPSLTSSTQTVLVLGNLTTSSTTDPLSLADRTHEQKNRRKSESVGMSEVLLQEIQNTVLRKPVQRERAMSTDETPANPTRKLSESFTTNLKNVMTTRRKRIESQPSVEYDDVPDKISYFQSRIGLPPEDTELSRIFQKRAAKIGQENIQCKHDEAFAESKEGPVVGARSRASSATSEVWAVGSGRSQTGKTQELVDATDYKNDLSKSLAIKPISYCRQYACDSDTVDVFEVRYGMAPADEIRSDGPRPTEQYYDVGEEKCGIARTIPSEHYANVGERHCGMAPAATVSDDYLSNGTEPGYTVPVCDKVVDDFNKILVSNEAIPETSSAPDEVHTRTFPGHESRRSDSGKGSMTPSELDSSGRASSSLGSPIVSSPSDEGLSVFDDMNEDSISESTKIVQERSKLLAKPLEAYNLLPTLPTIEEVPKSVKKTPKVGLRGAVSSIRNTFSRRRKDTESQRRGFFSAGQGQMTFDDNWSMNDTLRGNSGRTEELSKNRPKCIRDVVATVDITSFSQCTDHGYNRGKDHSVRNWKDVVERSASFADSSFEDAERESTLSRRSNSVPDLESLNEIVLSSRADRHRQSSSSSSSSSSLLQWKNSSSKIEIKEDGSVESLMRSLPTGMNTLPSLRKQSMIQSLDSIFPSSRPTLGTRHYQKKHETEPRKMPSARNSLLTPVQKRQQRSLAKR